MAKDANDLQRIAKYQARMFYENSKAIPVVMKEQKEQVMALVTQHFTNIYAFEQATKTILDEEGIDTGEYPAYLNFSRRIYTLKRSFSGESLINAVNVLLQEFVGRGFNQAILERIRDEVWTLPAPGP
jgi:hypothetical protein